MSELPSLALLAGGLATRMRPLTEKIPKSLLEVAGEPFLAHQLRLLARNGIARVVICAGFLAEQIEAFAGGGSAFGLSLSYSVDWPELLGTGGALKKALPLLGEEFFVLYGDSYLDIPYAPVYEAFQRSGKKGLMTVLANENRWDASNIEFRNGAIAVYDKRNKTPAMRYIDYGLGVLRASAFDDWPEAAFDLAALYGKLVDEGQMAGYEVFQRFYEIGSSRGLAETDHYIRTRKDA